MELRSFDSPDKQNVRSQQHVQVNFSAGRTRVTPEGMLWLGKCRRRAVFEFLLVFLDLLFDLPRLLTKFVVTFVQALVFVFELLFVIFDLLLQCLVGVFWQSGGYFGLFDGDLRLLSIELCLCELCLKLLDILETPVFLDHKC